MFMKHLRNSLNMNDFQLPLPNICLIFFLSFVFVTIPALCQNEKVRGHSDFIAGACLTQFSFHPYTTNVTKSVFSLVPFPVLFIYSFTLLNMCVIFTVDEYSFGPFVKNMCHHGKGVLIGSICCSSDHRVLKTMCWVCFQRITAGVSAGHG